MSKFVGATARRLSDAQFLVLGEHAGGTKPFVAESPTKAIRGKLIRLGLLIPCGTASTRGTAMRKGARFIRLSAEGRKVLAQAMMMRGGVPIIRSPSIEPKERSQHAEPDRRDGEPAAIRELAADPV